MKIVVVVPYEGLVELVKNTFREHCSREIVAKYSNRSFELEVIVKHDDFKNFKIDCDTIVARGDVVYTLRELFDIPIVKIPLSAFSVEKAVQEAIETYHPQKIGIIAFFDILVELENILRIPEVIIKTYYITERVQLEEAISQAIEDGVDVIVCGVKGCIIAQKRDFKSILIKTHKQELWHAFTEAKRSAFIYNLQKLETERFKNIFNYSFEGIVTIDKNQNIISYNNAAKNILLGENKDENIIDRLNNTIQSFFTKEMVLSDKTYTDEIINVGSKNLSINSIPILIKGEKCGKVIIFQDTTRIQKLENKIRKKIYERGHIAKYTFDDIIGQSPIIQECKRIAKEYSNVNSNILITGETGTGKELFAQSIHNNSPLSKGPFVAVNCAAIPNNLLESELFGYVSGAFTGASKSGKMGLFELAHKGTIFLDEISEVNFALQGRLLRVIQEKEIVKIGDDKITPVDVRIISASNRNLSEIVNSGGFRQDLYYRLDVLSIRLPSLNERREDIPLLAQHFIKKFKKQFSKPDLVIDENVLFTLSEYNWIGNIRQLRNICERLVVFYCGKTITMADIPTIIAGRLTHSDILKNEDTFKDRICYIKQNEILKLFKKYRGDKNKVSQDLGVSIATLYRWLKKYHIST
jgi:transcriptional regulator with PAS, ATPase and Fis domain